MTGVSKKSFAEALVPERWDYSVSMALKLKIIAGIEGTIDSVVEKLAYETLTGGDSLCKPGAGRGYGLEKAECDHIHED